MRLLNVLPLFVLIVGCLSVEKPKLKKKLKQMNLNTLAEKITEDLVKEIGNQGKFVED